MRTYVQPAWLFLRQLSWDSITRSVVGFAKSFGFTLASFVLLSLVWAIVSAASGAELPGPFATLKVLWHLVSNPFYDNGPNDKGIAIQLGSSLFRVFVGFTLGSIVAVPIGITVGASPLFQKLLNPIVQILKPVSPLAWFPIGLAIFKSAGTATIFVIFITSIWSTVINTAFGVASIPEDHKNVGRAFGFSKGRYLRKILIPYSLPHIITGLRVSLGVAWLVIVAGEMLAGGIGIGFFVWDSWNSLSLERVMSAILLIGTIGLLLDRGFNLLEKRVSYGA